MELVPVLQPDLGTFLLQPGNNPAHGFTTAIDVETVINGVYIAECWRWSTCFPFSKTPSKLYSTEAEKY